METCWPVLAAVQDSTGAVPETGPPLVRGGGGPQDGGGSDESTGAREAPREFLNCYHSTLVTAFAAALTLARNGTAGMDSGAGGSV